MKLRTALVAGLLACIAGLFVAFPVGCNPLPVYQGCSADPVSWWSTFWSNIVAFEVGLAVFAWGLGAGRSPRPPAGSLGTALIVDGFVSNFPSLVVGWFQRWKGLPYYATSCPANGCAPLTPGQWWSLFWPGVVAGSIGIVLIVAGAVLVLASRRPIRRRTWVPAMIVVLGVCLFLIAAIIDDSSLSFLAGI